MSKKLTDQQIDQLYEFCKDQKVKYNDVQIEIVDHLAEGIERDWKEDANLCFEETLKIQSEKFGAKGFKKLQREKAKSLNRKYFWLQVNLAKEFYTMPKLLLTGAITLVLFSVFKYSENDLKVFHLLYILHLILITIFNLFFTQRRFRLLLIPGVNFLLRKSLARSHGFFIWISLTIPTLLFSFNPWELGFKSIVLANNVFMEVLLALSLAFYYVLVYVAAFLVPKRIKADFEKQYPRFIAQFT